MRRALPLAALIVFGICTAEAQTPPSAAAPPKPGEGPIYAIGFYEVVPGASAEALALLKTYRDSVRKEAGAARIDVLEETGEPSRFVSYEIWSTEAAYDAHASGAAMQNLTDAMKPHQTGPLDVRTHFVYAGSTATQQQTARPAVIVLSHLDVSPASLPPLLPLLDPVAKGSVGEKGALRYQILEQVAPHPNHFRFFEEWATAADFTAHSKAAHTRTFREDLAPLLGTPYDQRTYRVVE